MAEIQLEKEKDDDKKSLYIDKKWRTSKTPSPRFLRR